MIDKPRSIIQANPNSVRSKILRYIEFLVKQNKDLRFRDRLLKTVGLRPDTLEVDPRGPAMTLTDSELMIVFAVVIYENGKPWSQAMKTVQECYDQLKQEQTKNTS